MIREPLPTPRPGMRARLMLDLTADDTLTEQLGRLVREVRADDGA